MLKILSSVKTREKWYLIDEIKSLVSSTNRLEHNLYWLIELGNLLQKSKWDKTLVIQDWFFKDSNQYLKETVKKTKTERKSVNQFVKSFHKKFIKFNFLIS